MSGDTLKVESTDAERTDVQAERSAPVSLPPGSYDSAELQKQLDDAAKAKNDKDRDQLRDDALASLNETPIAGAGDDAGVPPGYTRMDTEVVDLGITESRVVFDPSKADEAEAAQEGAPPVIQPGAADHAIAGARTGE